MEKWEDQIVREVREVREEYAARFGFDVKAICQDLRERQNSGGRTVVKSALNPRAPRPGAAPRTGRQPAP